MRYMRGLNEWLERDVHDRQSEIRGVVARVEQLSNDIRGIQRGKHLLVKADVRTLKCSCSSSPNFYGGWNQRKLGWYRCVYLPLPTDAPTLPWATSRFPAVCRPGATSHTPCDTSTSDTSTLPSSRNTATPTDDHCPTWRCFPWNCARCPHGRVSSYRAWPTTYTSYGTTY